MRLLFNIKFNNRVAVCRDKIRQGLTKLTGTISTMGVARCLALGLLLAGCVPATGPATDPATAAATVSQGYTLIGQKDYAKAKTTLQSAQPFRTGDRRALMGLAVASDMTGDFRTADRAYKELLLRETDRAMLFNNMAYSYMLRGDYARASAYLAEARRHDAANVTIANNAAMLERVAPLQ